MLTRIKRTYSRMNLMPLIKTIIKNQNLKNLLELDSRENIHYITKNTERYAFSKGNHLWRTNCLVYFLIKIFQVKSGVSHLISGILILAILSIFIP